MKHVTVILLFIMLLYNVNGQTKSVNLIQASQGDKELEAGDKVPDLTIKPIGKTPIQLSSLKGKLVILDFFGVHCSGCIKALPEMQRMQDEFGDKIKILVVTKDDSSSVKKLLSRLTMLEHIRLPFVTNDSLLSAYFYYASLPTHVWVDTNGVVIQKTEGYNTSEKKINDWLAGKKIYLPEKKEFANYQRGISLLTEGGGRQINHVSYYSLIMGRPEGLNGQSDLKDEHDAVSGKLIWLLRSQVTLLDLYRFAFAEEDKSKNFVFDPGRVLLEVDHPEIFDFPEEREKQAEWREKYFFSYEIKVPVDKSDRIFHWMKQDLERYFGYTASIQQRKIKCWVLKAVGQIKIDSPKGAKAVWDIGPGYLHMANISSSLFFANLQYSKCMRKLPLINEITGVQKFSLNLNCDLDDIKKLRAELLKHNILLHQEEREMKVLIVSGKGNELPVMATR